MLDIECVTSRALPPVATDHLQGRDGHGHHHLLIIQTPEAL